MTFSGFMLRLALVALSVTVGVAMLEGHLLYFPQKVMVSELVGARLTAWPGVEDFRGLVAAPAGVVRGTVLVFHGNAGHAGHRAFYAEVLTRLGFRVILAEYPGYGPRSGEPGERQLVDDAETTVVRAYRQYGAPLLLLGESLGAAVAAQAGVKQRDEIAGLLLITPWDSLENVAKHHYPWLPVEWLLQDRYDTLAHLASFDRPVVVVLAEQDNIVPLRFGLTLYESLSAQKYLKLVPQAGHNDWLGHLDEAWWRGVTDFLLGDPGRAGDKHLSE